MADTYLIVASTVQPDQDKSNGSPLLRTVAVDRRQVTVFCEFNYPWSERTATAAIPRAAAATGITESDLSVVAFTRAEYEAATNAVYGALRATAKAQFVARSDALKTKASALLDARGFSRVTAERTEELKALLHALDGVREALADETGGEL